MDKYKKLILPALLLGALITALFTAHMSWTTAECSTIQGETTSVEVSCANMTYGFPSKFIQTSTSVEILDMSSVETSSKIQLKPSGLVWNLLVWSVISAFILNLSTSVDRKTKPKSKSTKKK